MPSTDDQGSPQEHTKRYSRSELRQPFPVLEVADRRNESPSRGGRRVAARTVPKWRPGPGLALRDGAIVVRPSRLHAGGAPASGAGGPSVAPPVTCVLGPPLRGGCWRDAPQSRCPATSARRPLYVRTTRVAAGAESPRTTTTSAGTRPAGTQQSPSLRKAARVGAHRAGPRTVRCRPGNPRQICTAQHYSPLFLPRRPPGSFTTPVVACVTR